MKSKNECYKSPHFSQIWRSPYRLLRGSPKVAKTLCWLLHVIPEAHEQLISALLNFQNVCALYGIFDRMTDVLDRPQTIEQAFLDADWLRSIQEKWQASWGFD